MWRWIRKALGTRRRQDASCKETLGKHKAGLPYESRCVTSTSEDHVSETTEACCDPTSSNLYAENQALLPPRPTTLPRKAASWSAGSEIKFDFRGPERNLDYLQLEIKQSPTNTAPRTRNTETLAAATEREPTKVQRLLTGNHMTHANAEGDTSLGDDHSPLDIIIIEDTVENKDRTSQRHARRKRKEANLRSFLWRSLKTRASYAEKRSKLRESRLNMGAAEERLMKYLREMRIQNFNAYGQDQFEEYFRALQEARDAYGPMEESVEATEDQLDKEEYEITQLQEWIAAQASPLSMPSNSDIRSQSSSDIDSATHSLERPNDPLYDDFLSRLGDADLLHEEHSDLVYEHHKLQESHKRNQKFGLGLLPEDQATLDEFQARQTDLLEQIRIVEEDIERLRILCVKQGLLDEEVSEEEADDGVVDSQDKNSTKENEDIDILKDISEQANEYSRFSQLLNRPCYSEDEKESKALLTGFKEEDPNDRISRWLLHKVRSSCSEVELLHRVQKEKLNLPSDSTEKWQADVLGYWFSDPKNLSASRFTVRASRSERDITPSAFVDKLTFPLDGDLAEKAVESKGISVSHHIAVLRLDYGQLLRVDDKPMYKSCKSV